MKSSILLFGLFVVCCITARSQEFRNLGFDDGNTNLAIPEPFTGEVVGSVQDLLPGWKVFIDGTNVDSIFVNYNGGVIYRSVASLFDSRHFPRAQGRFSLGFRRVNDAEKLTLEQTAVIPSDARNLRFNFWASSSGAPASTPWTVTLDGNRIPFTEPALGFYNGDVSDYAGKLVTMDLSAPFGAFTGGQELYVDGLAFVVPEPRSAFLATIGFALLMLWFGVEKAGS